MEPYKITYDSFNKPIRLFYFDTSCPTCVNGGDSFEFEYDSLNRINQTNARLYYGVDSTGGLTEPDTFYFKYDTFNRIQQFSRIYPGLQDSILHVEEYTYDKEGSLTEIISYLKPFAKLGGSIDSNKSSTKFEYYSDIPNPFKMDQSISVFAFSENINSNSSLLGHHSDKAVKRVTEMNASGSYDDIYTYQYSLDKYGRVTGMSVTDVPYIDTRHYVLVY
jgi:hypothetical protein